MADYRRKKRNLNKVDFTNKTKNQSKRYLINHFESLGIKVPNYVNNPTTGNINKAVRRINNELDRIIEREKIESAERKALNRDTDKIFKKEIRSYNAQATKTLNQIKAYYPELPTTYINLIEGKEVTIPGFNRSFYLDNNLKKLDKFFETYNYIPNSDVLLQIIEENSAFYRMIESIIKKHQTQIISGNLEKIFDDGTITRNLLIDNIIIDMKEELYDKIQN